MEYAMIWIAAGAAACFILGLPREDIWNPLKALVFVALWPAWIGVFIYVGIKKNCGNKDA